MASFSSTVERAHHHELSLSHRMGDTSVQVAMYTDRVSDPALTGVGDTSADAGDVLPDMYSETFTYRGKELDARGMRVVLQRKLKKRGCHAPPELWGMVEEKERA